LADRLYTEISGGERQKVTVARAIVQQADIIILDEPTSQLDYGNQLRLVSQVSTLVKRGFGVIMTTHMPDHVFLVGGEVAILDKKGKLTEDEFSLIKSHTYYTKLILDRIESVSEISNWAANHHEKLNGYGYPRRLSKDEISEESRIIGVCDIYQALTEDRPYHKGMYMYEAFDILDDMVRSGFICDNAVKYLKKTLIYKVEKKK